MGEPAESEGEPELLKPKRLKITEQAIEDILTRSQAKTAKDTKEALFVEFRAELAL